MKKIILVLFIALLALPVFAKDKKAVSSDKSAFSLPSAMTKEIKNWPKDKLEYLSGVYFELGKRFFELNIEKDSKACFYYAIQVYPLGKPAELSKKELKKNWQIDIP